MHSHRGASAPQGTRSALARWQACGIRGVRARAAADGEARKIVRLSCSSSATPSPTPSTGRQWPTDEADGVSLPLALSQVARTRAHTAQASCALQPHASVRDAPIRRDAPCADCFGLTARSAMAAGLPKGGTRLRWPMAMQLITCSAACLDLVENDAGR